eukprot:TRINITY_DN14349_c0_g1_i1.p1 TRINITY_DN14349_c0_g1~~TRINITY_DN14349_c0_g1_i1.p1  ORF type:complete len:252 (+),score=11.83 TRINITY_DN14349_c0_g1_i1:64-819(+)
MCIRDSSSYIGLLFNLGGMFGIIVSGVVLRESKAYKNIITLSYVVSFMITISFVMYLNAKDMPGIYSTSFLLGVALQLYWNASLELGCELTFPVGEAQSAGWLQTGGCFLGMVQVYIMDYFMEDKTKKGSIIANGINSLFILVAMICSVMIKEKLMRVEHERFSANKSQQAQVYYQPVQRRYVIKDFVDIQCCCWLALRYFHVPILYTISVDISHCVCNTVGGFAVLRLLTSISVLYTCLLYTSPSPRDQA